MPTKLTNPKSRISKKIQVKTKSLPTDHVDKDDGERPLIPRNYPELVFGLVGPVGVDLDPVIDALVRELKVPGYRTKTIRLSKQIETFLAIDHSKEPEDVRIDKLMNEGTSLRETSQRGDAVG